MPGIAAAISWNGNSSAVEIVHRMLDRMPHRGSRRHLLQPEPGIALGLVNDGDPPAHGCVADVRLDNRSELEREIGDTSSDSELLRHGYQRWGTGLADRLRGDFALVLWDESDRSLYAGRDCFGVRPLYYHAGPEWLLLASELEPLVTCGLFDVRLDDRAVLDYLENQHRCLHETLFAGVCRVVPGHWLRATAKGRQEERYWKPPARDLPLSQGECVAAFRRLFRTAVADRIRGEGKAVAHLSGGLDSSSIVCMADDMVPKEPGPWLELETISAIYPGLDCDDSAMIEAVARRVRFPHRCWDGTVEVPLGPEEICTDHPCAAIPLHGAPGDLQLARQVGANILISGAGGDELLFERGVFRDLAARGRWLALLGNTLFAPRLYSSRTGPEFLSDAIRSTLPPAVRHAFRWLRPRSPALPPGWLGPALLPIWEAPAPKLPDLKLPDETRQCQWGWLTNPNLWGLLELLDVCAARQGVEMRYPFLDRRLADFVLAIPYDRRLPRGRMKLLLRQAMTGLLPAVVLRRRRITAFDSVVDVLCEQRQSVLQALSQQNSWLCAPYANEKFVREWLSLLDKPDNGPIIGRNREVLLNLVQFELWLRALRDRGLLGSLRSRHEHHGRFDCVPPPARCE